MESSETAVLQELVLSGQVIKSLLAVRGDGEGGGWRGQAADRALAMREFSLLNVYYKGQSHCGFVAKSNEENAHLVVLKWTIALFFVRFSHLQYFFDNVL